MIRIVYLVAFLELIANIVLAQSSVSIKDTVLVKDIVSGKGSSTFGKFVSANGLLFFEGNDGINGTELWRSDGTADGTYMLRDINSGKGSANFSLPIEKYATSRLLFFLVSDNLWRSDGTTNGTFLLKKVFLRDGERPSYYPVISNEIIYFSSSDDVNNYEPWRSDGTVSGTYMIKDIIPPVVGQGYRVNSGSDPKMFVNFQSSLYFIAGLQKKDSTGRNIITNALYRSDGISGIVMLREIDASTLNGQIYNARSLFYFNDIITGGLQSATQRLWRSDGTEAGTYPIKEFNRGIVVPGNGYYPIATVNELHYFSVFERNVKERNLWRTDGTTSGTFIVKNDVSNAYGFVNYSKKLYFTIKGNLWCSDGTVNGTTLIKYVGRDVINFIDLNGVLYFGTDELWRSDGTTTGTFMVKDIRTGTGSSTPADIVKVKELIYFTADNGTNGRELWQSDGTLKGTVLVKDITPGRIGDGNGPQNLTNVRGTLFFSADNGTSGRELWRLGRVRRNVMKLQHFSRTLLDSTLREINLSAEDEQFKICADGSDGSIFKASGANRNYINCQFRIKEYPNDSDALQGGKFTDIQKNTDSLVVRYQHPDYIITTSQSRILTLELIEKIDSSIIVIESHPLIVYRAPLLLVHGLWSGPESFAEMEERLSVLYPSSYQFIKRADYSATNNREFNFNVPQIPVAINDLLKSLREQGIGAGKVDYVGHSMGGILGRLYLQRRKYNDDIRRLITLNTPHAGSQVADATLISVDGLKSILCNYVLTAFLKNSGCNDGAMNNLQVGSDAIRKLLNGESRNYRTVPSHALATVYNLPFTNASVEGMTKKDKTIAFYVLRKVNSTVDNITMKLFGEDNDGIVGRISQLGGLSGNCTSLISNQYHTGSPSNILVISRVKSLLMASPASYSFCTSGFAPPELIYSLPWNNGARLAPSTSVDSIRITSPSRGKTVTVGQSLTVSVTGTNIKELNVLVDYNNDTLYFAKDTSYKVTYTLSVDGRFLGKKSIVAVGRTSSGGYVSDTTHFFISDTSNTRTISGGRNGVDYHVTTETDFVGRDPDSNRSLIISPNPTGELIELQYFLAPGEIANITIRDIQGGVVQTAQAIGDGGVYHQHISLRNKVAGIYTVQVITGGHSLNGRILLIR